jgi:lipopolysaccharide/colanic/teichoic acid biosynthesis glycosyltransferase
LIANGKDFDLEKEKMIQEKLQSKMFYKKAFLLGTYDFELKVGDDILQKRVIALPFSLLAILLLFPVLYLFLKFLLKKTDQKEKEKIES